MAFALAIATALFAPAQERTTEQLLEAKAICEKIAAYDKKWNTTQAARIEVVFDGKVEFFCKVSPDVIHHRTDRRFQEEAQP